MNPYGIVWFYQSMSQKKFKKKRANFLTIANIPILELPHVRDSMTDDLVHRRATALREFVVAGKSSSWKSRAFVPHIKGPSLKSTPL